jgi:phosphoenolpyruvate carboxylase
VDSVLRIRETTNLIADVPVLQAAIALRNPYVDPLSLLQIALLERKRFAAASGADHAAVDDVLATTLSGIAQGLRNTG